ncbi:hypothetical protein L484_011352 [Morus notabilis]|uniref:Uncharacterized protein n=1 Tax=Morus notabilis TaxID=981085 RepID=W9SWQ0_9ROSA|nr:hypothetical protein L484_011352 [Morus notabilis]
MVVPWLSTALKAISADPWCKSERRSLPKVNTTFSRQRALAAGKLEINQVIAQRKNMREQGE